MNRRQRESNRLRVAGLRTRETNEIRELRLSQLRYTIQRNQIERFARSNIEVFNNENSVLQNKFEDKMKKLEFWKCSNCNQEYIDFNQVKCCSRNEIKYSEDNDMQPGDVPDELKCLSPLEELLIAQVHPVMSIYKTKGQQLHYSGQIINFPQDVKSFSLRLPNIPASINSMMVVRKQGKEANDHTDFIVSASKIKSALIWLKNNNEYYRDIEIDYQALSTLPENESLLNTLISTEVNGPDDNDDTENVYTTNVPQMMPLNQNEEIERAINGPIDYPVIQDTPVDEFRTAGYIACAFPKLFPNGKADLRAARQKKISPVDYFKFLMNFGDRRFSKHPRFPFFAMNSTLRWQALSQGNIFIKKNSFQNKSVEEIKALLETRPHLANNIMYYGSTLRGSKAFWYKRCGELLSMVNQLGTPTIFFTLSAADLHWPDLFRLLAPNTNNETLKHMNRTKLMSENPLIVATFFNERVKTFVEDVINVKFKVKDFWYRFEWQHRGSPHIHGVLWIDGAPNLDSIDNMNEMEIQNVISYFDGLISAWNPNKDLSPSNIHPCQIRLQDIENIVTIRIDDYTRLLNKVQRHTVCSANYCLRKKKGSQEYVCRFKFPIDEKAESIISDEKGIKRFVPKRNDQRLNLHNPFVTSLWRANTDFQPIISKHAVLNYISKYVSKSEPQSNTYKEIFNSMLGDVSDEQLGKGAIKKLLLKSVAERDYSSQEVVHILMGLPLYHSTRQFINLTLHKEEWISLPGNNEKENFVEKYKSRPAKFKNECLFDFTKRYYKRGSKWSQRRKEAVVRIFPNLTISESSSTEDKEDFYRQQCLLYLSWTDVNILKGNHLKWESLFIEKNLNGNIDLDIEIIEEDEELEEIDDESLELEEFMIAARGGPNRELMTAELGNREIDLNWNWNESYHNYENVEEFPNYLNIYKRNSNEREDGFEFPDVIFSQEQQEVIDLLNLQIEGFSNTNIKVPKRTIIQGKGGSGKSTVIQAMTSILSEKFGSNSFLLIAPTGVAAVNIKGSTIHSALHIGIMGDNRQMNGLELREFQLAMSPVKFLICDEYSMVGSKIYGKIDQRCRDGKPQNSNEIFGGLFVYIIGDIKQLPPVMDRAPYSKGLTNGIGLNGQMAYKSFEHCIILGQSQRQAGTNPDQIYFRELLDRLSFGQSSLEDWKKLSTRSISKVNNYQSEFKDAIRLFPTRELVNNYNSLKLREIGEPVVKINAKHNNPTASKGSSDVANGLSKALYFSKESRVMLKNNLWTKQGLVNGATGIIKEIIYRPGNSPSDNLPMCILIKFEKYNGPFCFGDLFPIVPVTRNWTEKGINCSRTQFPLTLGWGSTIHKSQGITTEKAVVDLGDKEFSPGLTYVALSRLKSFNGLVLDPPVSYERINKIGKSILLKQRIDEENRLQGLKFIDMS